LYVETQHLIATFNSFDEITQQARKKKLL